MKKYLITGLVILLPLALTIAIIAFVVQFLTKPFMGIVSHFLARTYAGSQGFWIFSSEQTLRYGSQLIILICLFLGILFLGMIARWYFVHSLIQLGESVVHRLPIVNKLYRGVKDIITQLFGQGNTSFQQVVLVPFPRVGIYAIGFLSEPAPKSVSERLNKKMITVFVPTAPNPTTGFTMMFDVLEILFVDIKVEDALKYIVSCGMVTPPEAFSHTATGSSGEAP